MRQSSQSFLIFTNRSIASEIFFFAGDHRRGTDSPPSEGARSIESASCQHQFGRNLLKNCYVKASYLVISPIFVWPSSKGVKVLPIIQAFQDRRIGASTVWQLDRLSGFDNQSTQGPRTHIRRTMRSTLPWSHKNVD